MGENDSIITFGLEAVEETEKSGDEIVSEVGKDAGPQEQAAPDKDQQTRDLIQQAREHEAAERAQEMEQSQEMEHGEMER